MWGALIFLFAVCSTQQEPDTVKGPGGEIFIKRVVAAGLSDPWEITYGADSNLWITEAKGYRVSKINPSNGSKKVLLDLNHAKNFTRQPGSSWPQGGLMGLALHPGLLKEKPYVYLSYVYNFKGCESEISGCFFTTRIVRYRYDAKADTLVEPEILCDTIPGSNDHNGGRLLVAPVNGKDYLFYAIGEMGAGQFKNVGRTK